MSSAARRVVLLARPGAARDRMREALDQAGANVVLEADPTGTDQASVLSAKPEVALVLLDTATDEALDRFDGLLSDPAIDVLFEEAELAIGRVGWDAARWVRHLSAKLHRSDDVLPPGRSASEPLSVLSPAIASVADIPAPAALQPEPQRRPENDDAPAGIRLDMELLAIENDGQTTHHAGEHGDSAPARFDLELVDDAPAGDTSLERVQLEGMSFDGASFDGASSEIRIEGLELEDDAPADAQRFQSDLDELHSRIASMELVPDESPVRVRGAVLVLAGIGGPDAVRQLLGALPEAFPRPVLVQQRLDGGHYDKLVAQMQRATSLPVRLAIPGDTLQPATVYILSPALGVQDGAQGLAFIDTPVDMLTALPAGDSAVLLLSGADPGQVDAAMKFAAGGGLIAGQAPDGCYDVAAPAALAARGGQVGKPQELAARLAARWH